MPVSGASRIINLILLNRNDNLLTRETELSLGCLGCFIAVMDEDAAKILALYFDKKELSIRGYQRIRKLARTIADLRAAESISKDDVAEAILMNRGMEERLGKGEL